MRFLRKALTVAGVVLAIALVERLVGKYAWTTGLSLEPSDVAKMQMRNLAQAIEYFKAEKRALPRTLDELTQPAFRTGEPYVAGGKVPLDPWEMPYEYRVVDERHMKFEISSSGPDKRPGTDDDLFYPDRDTGK